MPISRFGRRTLTAVVVAWLSANWVPSNAETAVDAEIRGIARQFQAAIAVDDPAGRLARLIETERALDSILSRFPETPVAKKLAAGEQVHWFSKRALSRHLGLARSLVSQSDCFARPDGKCLLQAAIAAADEGARKESIFPTYSFIGKKQAEIGDNDGARATAAATIPRSAVEIHACVARIAFARGNRIEGLAALETAVKAMAGVRRTPIGPAIALARAEFAAGRTQSAVARFASRRDVGASAAGRRLRKSRVVHHHSGGTDRGGW